MRLPIDTSRSRSLRLALRGDRQGALGALRGARAEQSTRPRIAPGAARSGAGAVRGAARRRVGGASALKKAIASQEPSAGPSGTYLTKRSGTHLTKGDR
jgi:hypothetical protein